ncbi:MAG: HD domain-containing phosphohydrolase, partial [Bacillota bacterium]
KRMNLPVEEVANLYLGGLLHDLGKLFIPADILLKNGVLDESERAVMRLHPMIGARFLESLPFFTDMVPAILHHHERIDGKGYPRGLSGGNIPLQARIIGVAEAFDAMTADDSYRTPVSLHDAIRVLLEHSGTQFDGGVVQALLNELEQAGVTAR